MLRDRDAGVGKISFVDISDPTYSPEDNAGISFEQVGCLGEPASMGSVLARRLVHHRILVREVKQYRCCYYELVTVHIVE